jgi:very-short-patch-repair endonuclease
MIDWEHTGTNPGKAKNKDHIYVTCEKCNTRRQILYQVAKRNKLHICMSCRKSKGSLKTNQIVQYICKACGLIKEQKYRPDRYHDWMCHKCSMIKAHKDNKFNLAGLRKPVSQSTREKTSLIVTKLWQDPKYVEKWKIARKRTKLSRSVKSKEVWAKPEVRLKAARSRANQPRRSNIQKDLYNILDDLNINYIKESSETVIGFYTFDCLLPDRKILIEVQGEYWHSLNKNQNNDRSKFTYINKYYPDYNIIYIWEHEFKDRNNLVSRIRALCGLDQQFINFELDSVQIVECDKKDVKSFMDAYHYIGGNKGGIAFGGYLDDDLIVSCLFSPPIRQNVGPKHGVVNKEVIELSRLCIHPHRHKKNLASWFVSKCIKKLPKCYKLLVTYADSSMGHEGTVYRALNFKYSHEVKPNYWYVDEYGNTIGKKRIYDKAVEIGLKESEYASFKKLVKKYGGSKQAFIYDLRLY